MTEKSEFILNFKLYIPLTQEWMKMLTHIQLKLINQKIA